MHSKIILGTTLFGAVALADISIDISKAQQVASDVVAYVSSVTANPAFQSDLSALQSAIPSSVIAQAESNPEAFAEAIFTATALPSWVSAIPTPVIDSLETLAAKPVKAAEDVFSYIEGVITGSDLAAANSIFATAIPSSVIAQLEANPESFIEAQFTATAPPAYITALPAGVESQLGSFVNKGLSIIASDLEASSVAPLSLPTRIGAAQASGTGAYYAGNSALSFTGAASSVTVNTVGAGVLAAFGIVLALL